MIDIERVFHRATPSSFRRPFKLQGRALAYLETWGIERVMQQAVKFIDERLAPAQPRSDGRQSPWRNRSVFLAQHATATCCRGCLEKTHEIAKGHAMTAEERGHVLEVLERWLKSQSQ